MASLPPVGSVLWVVSVTAPEQRLNLRPVSSSYGLAVGQGSLCGLLVVFNPLEEAFCPALLFIRPAALRPHLLSGSLTFLGAAISVSPADHRIELGLYHLGAPYVHYAPTSAAPPF